VEAVFRSHRPASICPAGASEGDAYTWGERLPRPAARTRKKWTPAQPYRGRASGTAASICALNLSGAPHRGRRLRKHLRSLLGKRKPRNRYKHLSPIAFRKTRHCKHLHCQRGVRKHLRTLRADLIGQPCAREGRVASGGTLAIAPANKEWRPTPGGLHGDATGREVGWPTSNGGA
jgi:hypothetical protein